MDGVRDRVSVVIPCHQAARFVHRAIESVLAQSYHDVEVVVVDDGSTDELHAALAPYRSSILLIELPDRAGASAARNAGIQAATGNILAFLDADDWWPPAFLRDIASRVQPGIAVAYDNFIVEEDCLPSDWKTLTRTDRSVFSEATPLLSSRLNHDNMHLVFNGAPMLKLVIHRSDVDQIGGFDTRFYAVEDFHFVVKLLANRTVIDVLGGPKGFYLHRRTSTTGELQRSGSLPRHASRTRAVESWLTMAEVMPDELPLNSAAVALCNRGKRYWRARYAEALLIGSFRERSFRRVLNRTALKHLMRAMPGVISLEVRKMATWLRRVGPSAAKLVRTGTAWRDT